MANNTAATLIVGCPGGIATGGGGSWGNQLINVFLTESRPVPETGTPTAWEVSVANTSGTTITMKVDVVCATAPASGTSNAAAQARGARIIKVVTQLPEGAKR